jgi:hypothetical protein
MKDWFKLIYILIKIRWTWFLIDRELKKVNKALTGS